MMTKMERYLIPPVRYAEVLKGDVIVTFADGKCALYSAILLHALFDQAEEIAEEYED